MYFHLGKLQLYKIHVFCTNKIHYKIITIILYITNLFAILRRTLLEIGILILLHKNEFMRVEIIDRKGHLGLFCLFYIIYSTEYYAV